MKDVDELRPLTAARLLAIWRESGWSQGEPAFQNSGAVLEELTAREMESFLEMLGGQRETETVNPAFDPERFQKLREV